MQLWVATVVGQQRGLSSRCFHHNSVTVHRIRPPHTLPDHYCASHICAGTGDVGAALGESDDRLGGGNVGEHHHCALQLAGGIPRHRSNAQLHAGGVGRPDFAGGRVLGPVCSPVVPRSGQQSRRITSAP